MQTLNETRTANLILGIENRWKSSWPDSDADDMARYFEFLHEYVREGDWGLAVETLSEYLLDSGIPITEAEYSEMMDLLTVHGNEYLSKIRLSDYKIIRLGQ